MDNNQNNSQSWTDPITGEIYPAGNPYASVQTSGMNTTGTAPFGQSAQPYQPYDVQPAPQFQQPTPQFQQPVPQYQQPTPQFQQPYQPQQMQTFDPTPRPVPTMPSDSTKFCEHCGSLIARAAVVCPACGCQVGMFQQPQPQQPIIINNNNVNNNNNAMGIIPRGNPKAKWVAFFLCLFCGYLGAHRFYEGRIGTGILYLFTGGLFGIGIFCDLIRIATSTNPYYVK